MSTTLDRTNAFVGAYNNRADYPAVKDVAEDFGISEGRATSWASQIRRRNREGEEGLETIIPRGPVPAIEAMDRMRGKTEKAALLPGQTVNKMTGIPVPLSEIERKFQEDWSAEDCIEHLREVVEQMRSATGVAPHISRHQFREWSDISDATWNRYFGTFNEFRRQAGLELSRHGHRLERSIAKHASTDRMDALTTFKRGYEGRYDRTLGDARKWRRILVGTDFHGKKVDPFLKRMFLEANRRVQPDVINLNGDFFDLAEFGKYGIDPREFDILGDIASVHDLLRSLREDNPDAQLDFIEGNHEFRLMRHLAEQTPALRVVLSDLHGFDVPKLLGLDTFEVNYVGRASLKAFTERDIRHELERNFKVYWDCVLACHYPERRNLRIPGWGGHHHKHEVWPFFNPLFGACEFHQLGGGHVRQADYCDGEIWQNGFMIAHVNIETRRTVFEYVQVQDFCILGGVHYERRQDETSGLLLAA